ncbi:hypothetical protein [Kribbella sp. NPDC049227]|uniref:hypothetical protein n=1 Tax=Kribbella sp. NPDC049227 TaxID=3364113 RepID=UPI0037159E36
MAPSAEAERLARRLRDLRESRGLTQATLSEALSKDVRVAVPTISSWESLTNPKLPPKDRLRSYALVFSKTSAGDTPRLPREQDLTATERDQFNALHQELIDLRDAVRGVVAPSSGGSIWTFESGPITIVCPEVPDSVRSPLAKQENPNYAWAYRYADLDALIELWGQVRASNPKLPVEHVLSTEVGDSHLNGHLIVLGGIGWNRVAVRLQRKLADLPIRQVVVPDLENGEIFRLGARGGREFRPEWMEIENDGPKTVDQRRIAAEQAEDVWRDGRRRELVEDVALLARLRNPYMAQGTVTICSGVYSRGVLGAVRALTNTKVRDRNEAYIANRFPSGSFAMLLRVEMTSNGGAVAPDLQTPANRLFEWSPDDEAGE